MSNPCMDLAVDPRTGNLDLGQRSLDQSHLGVDPQGEHQTLAVYPLDGTLGQIANVSSSRITRRRDVKNNEDYLEYCNYSLALCDKILKEAEASRKVKELLSKCKHLSGPTKRLGLSNVMVLAPVLRCLRGESPAPIVRNSEVLALRMDRGFVAILAKERVLYSLCDEIIRIARLHFRSEFGSAEYGCVYGIFYSSIFGKEYERVNKLIRVDVDDARNDAEQKLFINHLKDIYGKYYIMARIYKPNGMPFLWSWMHFRLMDICPRTEECGDMARDKSVKGFWDLAGRMSVSLFLLSVFCCLLTVLLLLTPWPRSFGWSYLSFCVSSAGIFISHAMMRAVREHELS